MRLEKVRFAAVTGIARVLRFAVGMPRIRTATPSGKFDRIPGAEVAAFFSAIRVSVNHILAMDHDRRMACQADECALGAFVADVEEHRVLPGNPAYRKSASSETITSAFDRS